MVKPVLWACPALSGASAGCRQQACQPARQRWCQAACRSEDVLSSRTTCCCEGEARTHLFWSFHLRPEPVPRPAQLLSCLQNAPAVSTSWLSCPARSQAGSSSWHDGACLEVCSVALGLTRVAVLVERGGLALELHVLNKSCGSSPVQTCSCSCSCNTHLGVALLGGSLPFPVNLQQQQRQQDHP